MTRNMQQRNYRIKSDKIRSNWSDWSASWKADPPEEEDVSEELEEIQVCVRGIHGEEAKKQLRFWKTAMFQLQHPWNNMNQLETKKNNIITIMFQFNSLEEMNQHEASCHSQTWS